MSSPDFFDELERHLDRAAHRQARYGRLATVPFPSATALVATVLVALAVGAGAFAVPRLAGPENEVASPPTPRGPEAIMVMPDVIRLGEGLVGVDIAKSDGRLYVLAGRYEDETGVSRPSEAAVLAAFDDAGTELWRTEVDGAPDAVRVVDGDPWVTLGSGPFSSEPLPVVKVDAEDGHVLGEVGIRAGEGDIQDHFFEGFGALWVTRREPTDRTGNFRPAEMVRMDPRDLSAIPLDVPFHEGDCRGDHPDPARWCADEARAGAGAVWVPLKDNGVAVIDPDTNDVTVIGAEEIGHQVQTVAFDGDVAYVASSDRVSSIVEGRVVATASVGEFTYLGPVDGVFGAVDSRTRRLQVLQARDPMVVGSRRVSMKGHSGPIFELEDEAWYEFGRNYSFRRIEIRP